METGSDTELTTNPLSAVELFFAGSVFQNGSAYLFLDYHDGHIEGLGRLGAHPSPFVNLYAGLGDPFDIAPYNTLHGHELTTAHHHDNEPYAAADGRVENFYYALGAVGGQLGADLADEWATTGRIAYDIAPVAQVGLLGRYGRQLISPPAENNDHALTVVRQAHQLDEPDEHNDLNDEQRPSQQLLEVGADTNIVVDNLHLLGLAEFQTFRDDMAFTGSAEVYYTHIVGDRPLFMPLARVQYQRTGEDDTVSVLANISSYVVANARLGLEYDQQLVVPADHNRVYRITGFAHWQW